MSSTNHVHISNQELNDHEFMKQANAGARKVPSAKKVKFRFSGERNMNSASGHNTRSALVKGECVIRLHRTLPINRLNIFQYIYALHELHA